MQPEHYSSLRTTTRRGFIRQALCAAVGTAAITNTIPRPAFHQRGHGAVRLHDQRLQGTHLRLPQRRQRFQQPHHPDHHVGVQQLRRHPHPCPRAAQRRWQRRGGPRAQQPNQRWSYLRHPPGGPGIAELVQQRQTGGHLQRRHAGLSGDEGPILRRVGRAAAATFFPRRPTGAMADEHPRPPTHDRVGAGVARI